MNLFPKWANKVPHMLLPGILLGGGLVTFVIYYWFSPKHTDVGYMPEQPIPYSHRLHVGELGLDCRYCHVNVERAAAASIPSTETCMNCHSQIKTDSPHILKIKESYETGKPIEWVKVHNLPDYAYFDHSVHVTAGVSCVSCHGQVDQMVEVRQVQPLSMSWCLECHRNPAPHIRPKEFVTDMNWQTENPIQVGSQLIKDLEIAPREDCNTCHR